MSPITRFFNHLEAAGGARMSAEPPREPEELNVAVQSFTRDHPAALAHPLWLQFLAEHGGATVEFGRHSLVMLGFDDRICPELYPGTGEEPVVDSEGFMDFAVLSLEWPERPVDERYLDLGFCFHVERPGVFVRRGQAPPKWFAQSFEAWLERIAAAAPDLGELTAHVEEPASS